MAQTQTGPKTYFLKSSPTRPGTSGKREVREKNLIFGQNVGFDSILICSFVREGGRQVRLGQDGLQRRRRRGGRQERGGGRRRDWKGGEEQEVKEEGGEERGIVFQFVRGQEGAHRVKAAPGGAGAGEFSTV